MKKIRTILIFIALFIFTCSLFAQDSAEDLSQQAANPIANLMSFPFQNNTDFNLGPYDRTRNVLNVQPVIPLMGGKLITRTIIPFVWIPDITAESGMLSSGLSDITFTAFWVPGGSDVMWGIGPVLDIPTGGDLRGTGKWNIGPSVVALYQPGDWTFGAITNNVWSFAGDEERDDVNKGLLQYFIVYQLGDGWYLNSAPIITVNWNAPEGQRWIVPFGIGGGKLSFIGKLPLNLQAQIYVNVVKPDIGPDWTFRFQAQILLPTSIFTGK